MDAPAKLCRECRNDVSEAIANGETICPLCGCPFQEAPLGGMSRRWRWALFWTVFLGTPAVTFAVSATTRGNFSIAVPIFITGALVAGHILARLYAKRMAATALMTILFTLLVLVAYGGIAFTGCLIVMGTR